MSYILLFSKFYIATADNDLSKLDNHTQTIIWGAVIGVSILFITLFFLIHFFYWRKKTITDRAKELGSPRERGILTEIKGNIFLILSSLFAVALIIAIISIIQLN